MLDAVSVCDVWNCHSHHVTMRSAVLRVSQWEARQAEPESRVISRATVLTRGALLPPDFCLGEPRFSFLSDHVEFGFSHCRCQRKVGAGGGRDSRRSSQLIRVFVEHRLGRKR